MTANILYFLYLVLTTGFLSILYYHWKRRHLYKLAEKIPGPKSYPVIGAAHLFINHTDIVQNAIKILRLHGTPLKLWIFTVLMVLVSKPSDVKTVLTSPYCLEKEERYKLAKQAFGEGLLTAEVPIWKQRRKLINPTFNQRILDTFMDIFTKQSQILVQQLEKQVGKPDFDAHEYLSRCSLDIICETAIGVKVEAQIKPSKLLIATRRLAQLVVERAFRIWLHSDFLFKLTATGREYFKLLDYMHEYSGRIVAERKKSFNERSLQNKDEIDDEEVSTKRKPFLEHLLSMGNVFNDTDLRNEVDTFMHAGSDTTTTTVGYVLVALAMHQNIQEKVVEELCEVFENTDRPITLKDLPRLVYLEKVIKETMRLFPVAPFVARTATRDIEISDGKYTIPAGSAVVIAIMHTHTDPEFWPDPLTFDPDRFLPEEVAKRDPYSFIPFSAGPRNCIGLRFAMMSVKTILTTILRNYRIHTQLKQENLKFSVEIVSKLIGGVRISLTKRNFQ